MKNKRGKAKLLKKDQLYEGEYPLLNSHEMPINLTHAKKAIDIHDELIAHIMKHGNEEYIELFKQRSLLDSGKIVIKTDGDYIWNVASNIEKLWNKEFLPWFNSIPISEVHKILKIHLKRSQIKVVK